MNREQKIFCLGIFEGAGAAICAILTGSLFKQLYDFCKKLKG